MFHALVLAAQAFPVGDWSKDSRAEQAIAFRLEGSVVDRFRLGDFTVRPAPDLLRRCEADSDSVEIRDVVSEIEWTRTEQSASSLNACDVQELRPTRSPAEPR